jgi:hypothetical protein
MGQDSRGEIRKSVGRSGGHRHTLACAGTWRLAVSGRGSVRPAALRSNVGQLCAKFRHPLAAWRGCPTDDFCRPAPNITHASGQTSSSFPPDKKNRKSGRAHRPSSGRTVGGVLMGTHPAPRTSLSRIRFQISTLAGWRACHLAGRPGLLRIEGESPASPCHLAAIEPTTWQQVEVGG